MLVGKRYGILSFSTSYKKIFRKGISMPDYSWSKDNVISMRLNEYLNMDIECPCCKFKHSYLITCPSAGESREILCPQCKSILARVENGHPVAEGVENKEVVDESGYPESIYPEGRIFRLTNSDRLALEVACPYCNKSQVILSRTTNYRPVGTMVRCVECDLVWRVSIHINNVSLPEQEVEWRQMYKKGWRKPKT
jgi:transcription elongation factor Elf1